jgi:hypothetical protein
MSGAAGLRPPPATAPFRGYRWHYRGGGRQYGADALWEAGGAVDAKMLLPGEEWKVRPARRLLNAGQI